MNIERFKYQFATPGEKYSSTRNPVYKVNTTWYNYFNAIFDKVYFTEDELEFLQMLREDLQQELEEVDVKIKTLQK